MTDHVALWRIVERLQNFGLEKLLSAQSLLSSCGNLEETCANNADDGRPVCEVSERGKDSLRAVHVLFRIANM